MLRIPEPRLLAAFTLAALPSLNPITSGPTPAAFPWLASMACGLMLWALAAPAGARLTRSLAACCGMLVLWAGFTQHAIRQELVFLAAGLALITAAANAIDDERISRGFLAGLLAAALLSAVFGLSQYFGLSGFLSPWVNDAQAGEAFGNLRQPNQYATLCWLGLAVLLWGAPALPRPASLMLTVLLAVASAASVSRTGLLQGAVLTILAAFWPAPSRRWRLQLCAVAAAAYFAATVALPFALEAATGALPTRTLWSRIGGGESCSSRLVLWSNALHLIAQKPLLGWGWGEMDYAHFITLYPDERFCDILDNAHNLPLHLAVELGLPAALLVCGGFLWWAVRQRPWAERDPQRQLAWAMLAIILLHSMLEYPLWYGPFQIVFGASLGWLLAPVPRAGRQARAVALAVAAALFAATTYAAWDYLRVSQIYLPPEQRRAAWRDDPLAAAQRSWLFASQARFAELTITPLTRANAAWMESTAEAMLHYSPEPRVIERLIESATLNGHEDKALYILARYRAAFPREYGQWRLQQRPGQG